jgi:hypothetical protein
MALRKELLMFGKIQHHHIWSFLHPFDLNITPVRRNARASPISISSAA